VVRSQNNDFHSEHFLIDTGSLANGYRLFQYLEKEKVKEFEAVFITHMHQDHVGGLFYVLPKFQVGLVYDNGLPLQGNDIWEEYVTMTQSLGVKRQTLRSGDGIQSGGLKLTVVSPSAEASGDLNADSIVIRLTYGDFTVLLTGDLNQKGEKRLLGADFDLWSDILKVGHHAACDSSSKEFLERVSPSIAVISVSEPNRFGYLCPDTLQRLKESVDRVYRSDRDGTIVIETDGVDMKVRKKSQ
jgi:competence protein ComEC